MSSSCGINFLLSLERISRGSTRIAAAKGKNELLRDAAARNTGAAAMKELSGNKARINLIGAADAAPAHAVIIIVTALNRAATTLIMDKNAASHLEKYNCQMQKTINYFVRKNNNKILKIK